MLLLLVPTMVIVHIRSKALERAIEWVATLPLTIPAIVLVVGLGPIYRWLSADVLSTNPIWLCFAYVILVMPFAFRAIAVGLNSIDVKTLVEASRSLGASWPKVFFKVIIRTCGSRFCRHPSSPSPWCWANTPSPRCSAA